MFLLDANVVIALAVVEHEHHDRTNQWVATIDRYAVCPITQGALVRFLLRTGESPAAVSALLDALEADPRSDWIADDLSYVQVDLSGLRGHRQVTDTYLAGLAASHQMTLATLDRALADRRSDVCLLVPEPD